MFLVQFKNLIAKIKVNKILSNVKDECLLKPVKNIAVIFDQESIKNQSLLISSLSVYGFKNDNITMLVFENNTNQKINDNLNKFNYRDLSLNVDVKNEQLMRFVKEDFDVLINYYNIDSPVIKLISHWSNAKFKVGFSEIDNRLNHLIINSAINSPKIFVDELFKYLKILNKI